jgi:two-component system, chemotaxis family, protein-glutamate methylesterase/glutaminase
MIKVLIVDDSPSAAEYIASIFMSDPEFHVVGTAGGGAAGMRMVEKLKPDIVSMDFNMPDMDGFEATRRIMSTFPTPIVIVSSLYDKYGVAMSFKFLEAGALFILPKPPPITSPEFLARKLELLLTFKAMAGVKVIRRTAVKKTVRPDPPPAMGPGVMPVSASHKIGLIAIGASTGGPQVIYDILSRLPSTIHVPIVIVQHITPGFTEGLAGWLNQATGFPVSIAVNNDVLKGGRVYIAPQGVHLDVGRDGRILLAGGDPEHGVCPSISRFFRSVAASHGSSAIGVILTGMGSDGAAELKLMRDAGAVTIAQDRESSIVHGMPGEAIRLGGAALILPPPAIAAMISSIVFRKDN